MSDRDDLDDLGDLDDLEDLDRRRAELEARFRELEEEAELARLRGEEGGAPRPSATGQAAAEDPLAAAKAALDDEREHEAGPKEEPKEQGERYLLVLCPHCSAKNRVSLSRLRTLMPVCGACKGQLAAKA